MNWHLKYLIRHSLLALPGGDRAYRWLTATLLGTNAGMAYKWFRVLPAHVGVLQEIYGSAARAQRLWCFDCGATMAAGLAMALVSDEPGLLTDRRGRLHSRYNSVARRVLQEKGLQLAQLAAAPEERSTLVYTATAGLPAVEALSAIGITYAANHTVAQEPAWQHAIGYIFSAGTLEHYTPGELEEQVAGMREALKPGGVMSHVIDHRDHRWHADKRLSPLAHLYFEAETYQRRYANTLDYHNRWLRSRYIDLFTRHGFSVKCRDRVEYTPELTPLSHEKLASPYREGQEEAAPPGDAFHRSAEVKRSPRSCGRSHAVFSHIVSEAKSFVRIVISS